MGSSSRKRSSKKADFNKPKLKVGKGRPKPTNFTDTSFKSKTISIGRQSLHTSAPSSTSQFTHHVSCLNSRSDTQRRDSLAYLTSTIAARPVNEPLPQPVSVLLPRLAPLSLDGSTAVRTQLLKLLRALPCEDVGDHIETMLLYIRAGLTHLAADIRASATDIFEWALETAGLQVVMCPGGWGKTLKTLLLVLGWPIETIKAKEAWSMDFSRKSSRLSVKILSVLAAFLRIGLLSERNDLADDAKHWPFPLRHTEQHMMPSRSGAFTHLNLFGVARDEEGEMYENLEDRRRIFESIGYRRAIEKGIEDSRREGGEVGRAAAQVKVVMDQGMEGSAELVD